MSSLLFGLEPNTTILYLFCDANTEWVIRFFVFISTDFFFQDQHSLFDACI